MDKDISSEFLKILTKQGINFKLNSKVTGVRIVKNKAIVDFTSNETAKRERIECDKVLVAVGRKPNLGDDIVKLGIKQNNKKITVNQKLETSIKNIYAIGDVIDKELRLMALKAGTKVSKEVDLSAWSKASLARITGVNSIPAEYLEEFVNGGWYRAVTGDAHVLDVDWQQEKETFLSVAVFGLGMGVGQRVIRSVSNSGANTITFEIELEDGSKRGITLPKISKLETPG